MDTETPETKRIIPEQYEPLVARVLLNCARQGNLHGPDRYAVLERADQIEADYETWLASQPLPMA